MEMNDVNFQMTTDALELLKCEVDDAFITISTNETPDRIESFSTAQAAFEQLEIAFLLEDDTDILEEVKRCRSSLYSAQQKMLSLIKSGAFAYPKMNRFLVGRISQELTTPKISKRADSIYNNLKAYYEAYIAISKVLVRTYQLEGADDAARECAENADSSLDAIDFSKVESIANLHKHTDFTDLFDAEIRLKEHKIENAVGNIGGRANLRKAGAVCLGYAGLAAAFVYRKQLAACARKLISAGVKEAIEMTMKK